MRKLEKGEYVRINNEQERDEFLQYLEDNTDIIWNSGCKPTEYTDIGDGICVIPNGNLNAWWETMKSAKTEIPLSEFINPKIEKKPTTIELTKNEIKAIECFSKMAEIPSLFNAETKQAIESLMRKIAR